MNAQRKEVYAQRKEFMRATDVSETIADMRNEIVANMVRVRVPEKGLTENWQLAELAADLKRVLAADLPVEEWGREEGVDESSLEERIEQTAIQLTAEKEQRYGADTMHFIEKSVLIQMLDSVWKEHLYALDHLRQGIGLRAYGQRDPLNEYKSEAFVLFNFMLDELKERVTGTLSRVIVEEQPPPLVRPFEAAFQEIHPAVPGLGFDAGGEIRELEPALSDGAMMVGTSVSAGAAVDPRNPSTWGSVGRNAACPCGSGKKYKYCHGRLV